MHLHTELCFQSHTCMVIYMHHHTELSTFEVTALVKLDHLHSPFVSSICGATLFSVIHGP